MAARLGWEGAAPRCLILRADDHEHGIDATQMQQEAVDKPFAAGELPVAGAWMPSEVSAMTRRSIRVSVGPLSISRVDFGGDSGPETSSLWHCGDRKEAPCI